MKRDLWDFLPYLLNQASELVSREFQAHYKHRYGMLRTEWRVLFHLGQNGEMTAKQICEQAVIHKTKVSRAVLALEKKNFLQRRTAEFDRRSEMLTLTKAGQAVFDDLSGVAANYEKAIEQVLGEADLNSLKTMLLKLISERRGEPGNVDRISDAPGAKPE